MVLRPCAHLVQPRFDSCPQVFEVEEGKASHAWWYGDTQATPVRILKPSDKLPEGNAGNYIETQEITSKSMTGPGDIKSALRLKLVPLNTTVSSTC